MSVPAQVSVTTRRLLVPYGEAALEALSQAIAQAQATDMLAPVTVVTPSNLAGLSLRRTLGRQHGLLNVRFMVLARLAELLGAPMLASEGRTPLTRWRRFEAAREVLASSAGVFGPVASHSSTLAALDAAFRELRGAPEGSLQATATRGGRQGDVARLYLRFRSMTADSYDASDLALAAAGAVEAGAAALDDIGAVVLYLPGALTPADSVLIGSLLDSGRATLIGGISADTAADIRVRALGGDDAMVIEPAGPLAATHVSVAADAEEEARTAIRLAMAEADEGLPLDRLAVLYPGSGDYARLLDEQLTSAGIPHNGPGAAMLADSVPARSLSLLLALLDGGLTRTGVFEWLAAAPIIEAVVGERAGRIVPSRKWEQLARDAGIVGGIAQWRSRLGILRELREEARKDAADEGDDTRAAGYTRDIENITRLLAFIEELHTALSHSEEPPRATLERVRGLMERYLGGDTRHETWPEADSAAFQRVDEILREAAASANAATTFGAGDLRRALEWLLTEPGERLGPFGQGIFVGPLSAAAGMSFERVFVVGMAEGLVPPPPRIDALLPDDERTALGLPPAAEIGAEDRRRYLAALACAPVRTLIVGRADLRGGHVQQPSRWLLESASKLAGEPVTAGTLGSFVGAGWLTLLPSFRGALAAGGEAASEGEQDLRLLLAAPSANPLFALPEFAGVVLGIEAAQARAVRARGPRARLGRWEAGVGVIAGPSSPGARPVSPTALEVMATCPFKYFLKHQLGVRELDEPPDELRISPLVKGSLVHRILERFYLEAAQGGLIPAVGESWDAEGHARMRAVAEEECAVDEAQGLTGTVLLWELDRRRILDSLDRFLEQDDALRAQGYRFESAETSFGGEGDETAFELPDGSSLRFRGRIDRTDRAANGRVVVYDYKTGRSDRYKGIATGDALAGGRHLQLPVYALALGAGDGVSAVSAYYWFVDADTNPLAFGYPVTGQQLERFGRVVADLDATIEAGLFPANPGDTNRDNCRNCAFERVCPPQGTRLPRLMQRVHATPGLERYATLAGLDGLTEDDVQGDEDFKYE